MATESIDFIFGLLTGIFTAMLSNEYLKAFLLVSLISLVITIYLSARGR